MLIKDETAKIYVEVYGFEEDNEQFMIYADTLIIFSILSLLEIQQIFNKPKDIFPSAIEKKTYFTQQNYIIDYNGDLILVMGADIFDEGYSVFCCWWD